MGKAENMFYNLAFRIVRAFFTKTRILGLRKLAKDPCAILVANHLGAFGPISIVTGLSFSVYPWVIREVTDTRTAAEYIRKDFIESELGLRPPFSIRLSLMIGRICVALMHGIHAVPVYRRSSDIRKTFELSLLLLSEGKVLLIFPEIPGSAIQDKVGRFDSGFIKLAKILYERSGKIVHFYPLAASRSARMVLIGESINFDPSRPYSEEKERLRLGLESRVRELYSDMDRETSRSQPRRK